MIEHAAKWVQNGNEMHMMNILYTTVPVHGYELDTY